MAPPTRQRMIEIAYDLFGREGFHAVGLDRILAEVGVTKTTFYNHFESKDDLVLAVLEHRHEVELGQLKQRLREMGGMAARGQLEVIFDALNEWFDEPDFRGCIFITAAAEFPAAHDPAHRVAAAHLEETRELLEELATNAGATAPGELARQLLLLVEGAIVIRHVTGDPHAATRAGASAAALLQRYLPPVRNLPRLDDTQHRAAET